MLSTEMVKQLVIVFLSFGSAVLAHADHKAAEVVRAGRRIGCYTGRRQVFRFIKKRQLVWPPCYENILRRKPFAMAVFRAQSIKTAVKIITLVISG